MDKANNINQGNNVKMVNKMDEMNNLYNTIKVNLVNKAQYKKVNNTRRYGQYGPGKQYGQDGSYNTIYCMVRTSKNNEQLDGML
jgi:hypothetical protein